MATTDHLPGTFALAQVTSVSLMEAEAYVEQAYSEVGSTDRFALLRLTLELGSLEWQSLGPEQHQLSLEEEARERQERPAPEIQGSLIQDRIERMQRDAHVLRALSVLETKDRVVCFLYASGLHNPGDMAQVIKVPSERGREILAQSSRRFSKAIGALADAEVGWEAHAGADLDALARMIDGLTDRPSAALRLRIDGAPPASTSPVRPRRRRSNLGVAVFVILLAVAAGLLIPRLLPDPVGFVPSQTNVVEAAADHAAEGRIVLETQDPVEAISFLEQRLDSRFAFPDVEGLDLFGVGFGRLVDELQAPVLFYGAPDSPPTLFVVVIDYALLDRESSRLVLDRPTLDSIATPSIRVDRLIRGQSTITLRNRNDIYIAVSAEADRDLPHRVSFKDEGI